MTDDTFEPDGIEESEDLFGFDELYTPPSAVASSASSGDEDVVGGDAPAEPAEPQAGAERFDESDDLFNFDELTAEVDVAEEVDIDEILADIPDESEVAAEATEDSDASEGAEAPADASQTPADAPASGTIEPAAATPAAAPAPAASGERVVVAAGPMLSLRSPVTWILLGFTLLNLGLIGIVWRITNDVQADVTDATQFITDASNEILAQAGEHVESIREVQAPVVAPDPSRHTTFELARRELEAGEFAAAKQRLYALLAVADRLEPDVRESIEARAHFMLADVALALALATPEPSPFDDEEPETAEETP